MVPLLWHFGLALALVPPWFLDCVVAIGRPVIQVQAGVPNRVWIPVASGFLYGEFQEKLPDGQKSYKVYIVTNRHVESYADSRPLKAPLSALPWINLLS